MTDTSNKSSHEVLRHEVPGPPRDEAGPDLTERESEELLNRLGRGLRVIVGDVLLDPLPHRFQHLLEALERAEKPRRT